MTSSFTDCGAPSHNLVDLNTLDTPRDGDWLSALSDRGGPLVEASRRFLNTHCASVCPDATRTFPGSATLLQELARSMRCWIAISEVSENDERNFVEGAGALLGIILIAHVGDASHASRGAMHRIRLRKHGFFDPFAAVDRALDADNVRATLASEVSCAEAEAEGHGPIARVVGALSRALAERTPRLRIRDQFEGLLTLVSEHDDTPIELDLQRAIETTRDQPAAAAERVAQRYLSMLPGAAHTPETFAVLKPRLLPRLVRSDVLSDLSLFGRNALFSAPLVAELSIAIVIQEQGRARYLRSTEADGFGVERGTLIEAALDSLEACSQRTRLIPATGAPGVFVARTGDGRDSARVLLPSLHTHLSAKLGSRICIGIPHRDTFMVCAAEDATAVRALSSRVSEDAERAPHKLSSQLFWLGPHGLSPYDGTAFR